MSIVTLLTDFGLGDGTVGEMKGRLLALAPELQLVDLCHEIPAQDVRAAAYLLRRHRGTFPRGTVHLCVVDPTVGSDRRALAARTVDGHWLVGPDNGLFSAEELEFVVEIDPNFATGRPPASATFHGRDLFAPAAAHLARGEDASGLGTALKDAGSVVDLGPSWSRSGATFDLAVVWVDRFGNLVTDLPESELTASHGSLAIECGDCRLSTLSRTYADVERGQPLAYVGSGGTLELGVRDGSFAASFGVARGTRVFLTLSPSGG